MNRMLLVALLLPGLAYSQAMRELAVGRLLVANRGLPDPNFAETVILLVQFDKNGAMGVVVNHPTEIPISRALKEVDAAKGRKDVIFVGGPVEKSSVLALVRSKTKTDAKAESTDGEQIIAGVRLITSRTLLDKWLKQPSTQNDFRVYVGYAGWGAGQLEHELELGAWHVFNGDPAIVFDSDPDGIWPRLIRRSESRLAVLRR